MLTWQLLGTTSKNRDGLIDWMDENLHGKDCNCKRLLQKKEHVSTCTGNISKVCLKIIAFLLISNQRTELS
jgi:hypothetical protein